MDKEKAILKYIEMYEGEIPDHELIEDIKGGAYLDEPECLVLWI